MNDTIHAAVAQYADSRPHFTADQLSDFLAIEGHTDSVLDSTIKTYTEAK